MKNKKMIFFAILFSMIFCLFFAACPLTEREYDPPPISGSVSIDHLYNTKVGDTLNAVTTGLSGQGGEIGYSWLRGHFMTDSFTPIPDAINSSYVLQDADAGLSIRLEVSRSGYTGYSTAYLQNAVLPASAPELGGVVSIDGLADVGEILTVNLDFVTGETGTTNYEWFKETSISGGVAGSYDLISGANGHCYTLTQADLGRRIVVRIRREGHAYELSSVPVGPVTDSY